MIFEDANGDGKIDVEDKQYAGSALPKVITLGLNLGFAWKGIDLNMFFDGQFGHKIYNALPYYNIKKKELETLTTFMDSWRPDNTNTTIPRFIGASDDPTSITDNNGTNWAYTDRWLRKRRLLPPKNIRIGMHITESLGYKKQCWKMYVFIQPWKTYLQ